jgi:hypothetical protein
MKPQAGLWLHSMISATGRMLAYDGRHCGVIWGVSGAGLDNLIGEHRKIREAEAKKF